MPPAALRAVVPVPPPDPARSDLAATIERVGVCRDAVDRAEAALSRCHAATLDAMRSLDAAKAALRQIETDPSARIAVLMGEAERGPSHADRKRAADVAETVLAGAKADEELMRAEVTRRRRNLEFAQDAVRRQVAEVLKPSAAALLQQLHTHLGRAQTVRSALKVLPPDCLPSPFWDDPTREYPHDIGIVQGWRDAVAALAGSADATIPDLE